MSDKPRRSLKERVVPLAVVAVTLGAIVGFAQLGANLNSGASAGPAPVKAAPAAGVASNDVTKSPVNKQRSQTVKYWTKARMQSAKTLTPVINGDGNEAFGSAGLDFTRSRITPQTGNTAVPYRTTGKLFFQNASNGNFVCSASVIADRVIITAAHCIHSGTAFHKNWVFVPGFDGTRPTLAQQRPFGSWAGSFAVIRTSWITTGGALPSPVDFGAIVLPDQNIGGSVKKLSQVVGEYKVTLNHLFDTHVTMLGYPCNFDNCNIMQRVDSSDHRVPPGYTGGDVYEYGSDMTGGSSGGPWLENFGVGAQPVQGPWKVRNGVVAVTSYIYTDGGSALVEGASELDEEWTSVYDAACGQATGNC